MGAIPPNLPVPQDYELAEIVAKRDGPDWLVKATYNLKYKPLSGREPLPSETEEVWQNGPY